MSTHLAKRIKPLRKASLIAELDERLRAEAKLESSLSLIRATLEATTDGILVINGDAEVDHFNERFIEMWRIPTTISMRKDSSQLMQYLKRQLSDPGAYIISQATDDFGQSVSDFFEVLQLTDGQIFECYSIPQGIYGNAGRVLSVRDVTVRTNQARKIARLTRIHAILSGLNSAVMRAKEPKTLLEEVCRISVKQGGFMTAWVGMLQDGEVFEPIAWLGSGDASAKEQRSTINGPIGQHLCRQAVKKKEIVVCNDSESDTRAQFICNGVLLRGHRSLAALPINIGKGLTAVLVLYSDETRFFDKEQIQLLHRFVSEITLALEYMEKDRKLSHLAYNDLLTGLPNRTLLN
ncbi:MAG: GAF domain-containing protein, partial [Pyrinomonadaceae bacterium]